MTKEEKREYNRIKNKEWREKHREHYNTKQKEYALNNKENHAKLNAEWNSKHKGYHTEYMAARRKTGKTQFCSIDYDKIENFELALTDNFKGWVCHHRDQMYYKRSTLIERGEYYNLPPDKLIWLRKDEHDADSGLATKHPEQSKWHQRIYDR